jgi:DHA1 family bicyclomycin/chloramphenicol resistance-like MFS transporter
MAIGQFFYGPASDRFGRRGPLLIGGVIYILASVVCAIAWSPETLIGARFVQALGGCAGGVVARAVIRDHFSHTETARMLSLMMLFTGLAPILAPLIGGMLVNVGGWRLNFWVLTGFGVLVTTTSFLRLKESRSEETAAQARSENPIQAYIALLRQRRLLGYALAGALNGSALFTYIATSPDLLIGTYGIAPSAFGWVFGANAGGMILAGQINRQLLKRWNPDQVLSRSTLVTVALSIALTMAAVTGWGGQWGVLGLLFLLLASYGFIQGNTMAGALSVDPRRAGSISAMMGALSFGAGALASSLAAAFHDGTAQPTAITMLIGMTGSMLALQFMALPRKAQAAG